MDAHESNDHLGAYLAGVAELDAALLISHLVRIVIAIASAPSPRHGSRPRGQRDKVGPFSSSSSPLCPKLPRHFLSRRTSMQEHEDYEASEQNASQEHIDMCEAATREDHQDQVARLRSPNQNKTAAPVSYAATHTSHAPSRP